MGIDVLCLPSHRSEQGIQSLVCRLQIQPQIAQECRTESLESDAQTRQTNSLTPEAEAPLELHAARETREIGTLGQ